MWVCLSHVPCVKTAKYTIKRFSLLNSFIILLYSSQIPTVNSDGITLKYIKIEKIPSFFTNICLS